MTELASAPVTIGAVREDWSGDSQIFEYTEAANPIATGSTTTIPVRQFHPDHGDGTAYAPFDLSDALGTRSVATSPALVAGFVRLGPDASVTLDAPATTRLLYVLEGEATLLGARADGSDAAVAIGDLIVTPGIAPLTVRTRADQSVRLYAVDDSALLRFLGSTPTTPTFAATRYDAALLDRSLRGVAADPSASDRNRVSVLLGNTAITDTLTVTRTLWAMYGLLPIHAVQKAHRHQSVAVDLIIDAAPGCYTLVGSDVGVDGSIIDPVRVDWESGGVFVTPPGMWHSHHNESGREARLLPIQDAGLQTYLRTLDIRFTA